MGGSNKSQAPAPAAPAQAPLQAPGVSNDPQDTLGNAAIQDAIAAGPSYEPSNDDIAWIDGLSDTYVRSQIDGAFSGDEARKEAKKKIKRKKGQSQADWDAAIDAEVERKMAETTHANKPKGEAESLTGDQVFDGMDRATGTEASRKDFVALGVGLLGSVDKVREWFSSIRKADAPGGVWLHESARTRYEEARKSFMTEHPGWDFEPSYVGFQTRHRQHARNSVGMLSHMLGLAFDVVATDNPHLVNSDQRVLIETAGGDAQGIGDARLKFQKTDGTVYGRKHYSEFRKHIADAGRATDEGRALTGEAARLTGGEFDRAWDRYQGTERRMHDVLDQDGDGANDEVAELRAVAERYWAARKDIVAKRKALKDAQSSFTKNAPKIARDAMVADKKRAFDEASAKKLTELNADGKERKRLSRKEISEDPGLAALQAEHDHLRKHKGDIPQDAYEKHASYLAEKKKVDDARAALDAVEGPIRAEKNRILEPWFQKFDERLAGYNATAAQGDPKAMGTLDKAMKRLAVKGDKKRDAALASILADESLKPFVSSLPDQSYDAVVKALGDARRRAVASKDAAASSEAVGKTRGKLDDLDFVFGAKDTGPVFKDPTALQLAERGFIWEGEASAGHDKGVPGGDNQNFMKEFTRTMMKHGFAPGGQWDSPDGMHFEYVQGMSSVSKGAGATFGPEGQKGGA